MKKILISIIALALSAGAMADMIIPNLVGISFESECGTKAQSYWYEASDANDNQFQTGKDLSAVNLPSGDGVSATEIFIYNQAPYGNMSSLYTTQLAGKYVAIKTNTTDTEYKFVFNTMYPANFNIWFVDWEAKKSFKIVASLENPMVYEFTAAKGTTITDRFQFLESAAVFSHDREVAVGNWGTICYPELIDSIQGAVVYEIAGSYNNATQIAVVEVAVADMVMGKPYIFNATADAQKFFYNPEETDDLQDGAYGLTGTFVDATLGTDGFYVVKGQSFIPALGSSAVLANRAYLAMTDISAMDEYVPTSGVSARFFSVIRGTVTEDMQVAADGVKDGSYLVNGRLVIVKDGKTYNAQGF